MTADDFSVRQLQVLTALATHGNRRQAARSLGLAEQTFKNYLTDAYQVLGVRSALSAFRVLGWLVPR